MATHKYELFGDETTPEILTAFQRLYDLSQKKGLGKLSDLQKEVMSGVAGGMSYSKLQKEQIMRFNYGIIHINRQSH